MAGLYISWHLVPVGKSKEDLKFNLDLCRKGRYPLKVDHDGTNRVMCDDKVYKELLNEFHQ